MERFSTCDLREKDVINLCNGTRLGCPTDFEFNACDGKITALVIARPCGLLGLGHKKDIVIPWCKIECIGEDAILVKLSTDDILMCDEDEKRKKRRSVF